jgi:REP element-mobilizing transposase RayT
MPNHVHGLIGLTTESPGHDAARSTDAPNHSHRHSPPESNKNPAVESSRRDDSTTDEYDQKCNDEFRLNAHSLGAIIGQYKSMCTKRIRQNARPDFGWQRRYYDRIVRNRRELVYVRRYIRANPANWDDDRHAPSS